MGKLANIEALVAVVESGSFSKAAERLDIAKSVVSRRISMLENELGVQLLRRTTRTQSLTEPGRHFYQRAVQILMDLEEAEQSIVDTSAAIRGRLRLAAPLSFGLRRLNAALATFMQRHPGIELALDLNDREINLVEEGFDMAVRIGVLRDSTLLARRLGSTQLLACASPEYLARNGTPHHPSELERHIGLHYANLPLKEVWQFATGGREPLVAVPGIRMRANNGDALASAAAAGLGIINTPDFIVAELIERGRLVPVLTEYRRPPLGIYAVFPPGRLMPRRVQMLADFLADHLDDRPDREEELSNRPR